MIKVHVAADGTKSFQVYERARVREKSIKVYVGSFASRREAEFAEQQHRVTQRGIKVGELPAAVDHKRTMGDALDAWLRAIKDQRSHDEYESRMRLYVRPTFDSTALVKITKAKLIDLRSSLKEREEPIGNATINTLFASSSFVVTVPVDGMGALVLVDPANRSIHRVDPTTYITAWTKTLVNAPYGITQRRRAEIVSAASGSRP